MTAAASVPLRLVTCRADCPSGSGLPHHDRLLAVDTDVSVLLELIELAVTWHELDYSEAELVPPREWECFAERHRWADRERAEWAFLLASDIVRRGRPRSRQARPWRADD